jgi:hypothetical protein
MAEVIGTALAVVGVLGQVFDGCIKAYAVFSSATNFDADSQKLACKIRIEEMRLVVWGREWGVAEGKLEAHLSESGGGGMRSLALQILTELHRTVTDVQRLRERYGLVESEEVEGKGGMKLGKKGDVAGVGKTETLVSRPSETGRNWKKEITIRAKWVVAGKSLTNGTSWLAKGTRLRMSCRQG